MREYKYYYNINHFEIHGRTLTVYLGSEDPGMLEDKQAIEFAKKFAYKKGFKHLEKELPTTIIAQGYFYKEIVFKKS